MSIQTEFGNAGTGNPIAQGNDPKRKKPDQGKGSKGDIALNDALIVIGVCWFILLFLMVSLRHHNI